MCRGNGGSVFEIQTMTGTFSGDSDTLTLSFANEFSKPPKVQVTHVSTSFSDDSHVNIYVESVSKNSVTLRSSNVKGTPTNVHVYAIENG